MTYSIRKVLLAAMMFAYATNVVATHGMVFPGVSVKSLSMGGVSAAYTQDAVSTALNPAGNYALEDSKDIGLIFFSPIRKYSYTSSKNNAGGDSVKSGSNLFLAPQFGIKKKINAKLDASLSVYAANGMNTDWPRNNATFGDPGRMGVDYSQILVVPSMSYKLNSMHALGIAPMLGFQRVRLRGLQNFQSSSIVDPSKVTNNGYSYAYGVGARVGWQGKFNDCVQGGLTYSTKTYMSKFNKYKGLFAGGRLDVPSVISAGLKFNTKKDLILATDYERIQYSNIPALHNPFGNPFNLGDKDSGTGFGWRNISVYKFGAEYLYNHCTKLRAGISTSRKPYDNTQMDFNIIAPAVTQWHFMLGLAHEFPDKSEFSFVYMHAFKTKLTGASRLGGTSNLGTIQHSMYQHLLGISYGWK